MSRIPLLAELEAAEASEVMELLHAHIMPPQTEVLKAERAGEAMFFVASGHVQLRSSNGVIDYHTGDFFGAAAMIFGEVPGGAFCTRTRTRLLKLYRDDFQRLERINPAIGAHIRAVAASHVRRPAPTIEA
jgi:signal-transduction protein with cAMP-binding, CBS, and nucleotidyltransferase domain